MLIKKETLERINSGDVTLAFRRWRRPTVKSGGTLRTAIGELSIKRVAKTTARNISDDDARRAGYEGKAAMLAELGSREGDYYRIERAYAGADARIALREDDALNDIELADIVLPTFDFFAAREDFPSSVDQFLSTFRDCTGYVIFVKGTANAREWTRIGVHWRALALFRDDKRTIDFFAPREDLWLRPKAAP